jgi:hypothetical protein
MNYYPDNWVIIKINNTHYRVLAGWSGGYATGSSWRMNSGITSVTEDDNYYYFSGASGSSYVCHKESYGLKMNIAYVWNFLESKYGEKVELMPEETNWLELDLKIGKGNKE